jgi:hypothetical protein
MSKRSLIDSIEVKNNCSEDWNEMTGSEKVRFCSHCDLSVNNLSALTRKQAIRLVQGSSGRICVRYVQNPVDKKPLFAGKLYQISRRAGVAAGVLGASLALSTFAYAQQQQQQQSEPVPNKINSDTLTEEFLKNKDSADKNKFDGAAISFSGTITDPQGAVVPNASVTITNLTNNESRSAPTNDEGVYKFENVAAARYKVQAIAPGFKEAVVEMNVYNGEESGASLSLEISEDSMIMGAMLLTSYSSPFFRAVSNDDVEEVKNFIMRGENVNQKDENFNSITPLFLAVENGNVEIAEMLLNFRARVNARDAGRQTPLMRLDEDASPALVNLLIKHGAKINLADKDGNSALILAARTAKPEVLQILIRHSANLNAQNGEGRSALMEAADEDNLENVRALLEAGANVNLKDEDGETAFSLTTDERIEKLLADYGAAIEKDSN